MESCFIRRQLRREDLLRDFYKVGRTRSDPNHPVCLRDLGESAAIAARRG